MIAVIADDFTGAAEIGGIGLRYGLNVVIETRNVPNHNTDLLIIATDARSLDGKVASELISGITQKLLNLKPQFIYKKLDSVLRGNITEELSAQMEASGRKRALIIAANPVFNRIIRDGIYYIDDTPLNETGFANDPEYPINSSDVLEIVGTCKKYTVSNCKPDDALPETGLIIGDVTSFEDLEKWAMRVDENTLIAGASGFFDILLSKRLLRDTQDPKPSLVAFGKKALFVFGSTFPKDADFIQRLVTFNYYFSNMPEEMYYNRSFAPIHLENWVNDIVMGMEKHHKVVAMIDYTPSDEPDIASRIQGNMAELIRRVTKRVEINELMVEGGSTTSEVLKYLDIETLIPIQELDTGVIRMKIAGMPNLCLTTKPGSYYWPDSIWFPSKNNNIVPNQSTKIS
jgi:D-threonate/D-erythronate kinase